MLSIPIWICISGESDSEMIHKDYARHHEAASVLLLCFMSAKLSQCVITTLIYFLCLTVENVVKNQK